MKLRVTGLSSPPSIFWTRPFSTVTSSVQASGQSSGHAVRTVECPQVSGGAVRAMPAHKADFSEAFRVIAFAASPGVFNVLAIVPFIGPLISFLVGIWSLVIAVIAVREVLDYSSTGRAIIVCLIAAVICWIVLFVLF